MDQKSSNVDAIRFARAAAQLGNLLRARQGHRDQAQLAIEELERAYFALESTGSQSLLLPLLESADEYVAVLAAKMLLLYDETRALETLDRLSQLSGNIVNHARMYKSSWREGFLWSLQRKKKSQERNAGPNRPSTST